MLIILYYIHLVCMHVCILVLSKLSQILFNGTNFINPRLILHLFCLTHGTIRHWRNWDAQCCQLSNSADPFSNFFPFKKQALLNFWDSPALPRERGVLPRGRAYLPLSLFSERRRETALSIKHRYYVAFKTLNASIAEITAQLLSLSCVYLIFIRRRLDYQDFFSAD